MMLADSRRNKGLVISGTLKMLSFSTLAYQRDLDLRLRRVQVECERQKIL